MMQQSTNKKHTDLSSSSSSSSWNNCFLMYCSGGFGWLGLSPNLSFSAILCFFFSLSLSHLAQHVPVPGFFAPQVRCIFIWWSFSISHPLESAGQIFLEFSPCSAKPASGADNSASVTEHQVLGCAEDWETQQGWVGPFNACGRLRCPGWCGTTASALRSPAKSKMGDERRFGAPLGTGHEIRKFSNVMYVEKCLGLQYSRYQNLFAFASRSCLVISTFCKHCGSTSILQQQGWSRFQTSWSNSKPS